LPGMERRAALWPPILLTPAMLISGELLPKSLTKQRPTAVALRTFDALRVAAWLLSPLVWAANALVGAILQGLGHRERRDPFVSRDDLRLLFQVEPAGTTDVKEEEREMIDGIFHL